MLLYSAYGFPNPSAKKTELSWSPFPLEKSEIVRQWIHNCERATNTARRILQQNAALTNYYAFYKFIFRNGCCQQIE